MDIVKDGKVFYEIIETDFNGNNKIDKFDPKKLYWSKKMEQN